MGNEKTDPPPDPYKGGNQGGNSKFPTLAACVVVVMAMTGMARHNQQPLGDASGCLR